MASFRMKTRICIIVLSFVLFIQSDYTVYSESDSNTESDNEALHNHLSDKTNPETEANSERNDQHVEEVATKLEHDTKINNGSEDSSPEDPERKGQKDLEIFRRLFLQKRAQHIQAVDSLLESYEHQKTYQMIDLLLTRMRTVVGSSRDTLIQKGFEPGMPFPSDEDTKDALAVIMENAGLFGDMALKLPDITHACLAKKKSKVSELLKWSVSYSQDTGFLDALNTQMFNLASQELEIIPKDPDFINPYKEDYNFELPSQSGEKKKKAKTEKKRGPRATKVEL